MDEDGLSVQVFEKGTGWTLTCGTGSCATVVAATITSRVPFDEEVRIRLTGGELWIKIPRDLSAVYMRGPAVRIFTGELED
jgi:diaminopimelate epimerase